jgi:hypothetical protein
VTYGIELLSPAASLATRGFVLATSFGSAGSGPGQFVEPGGIAVNEASGEVFVADRGNNRIERFDSAGGFLAAFNGSGAPTGAIGAPVAIAVDNSPSASSGNVYVTDVTHAVVDKFDHEGNYVGQIAGTSEAPFGELIGVAVDPEGDVWVAQASGEVDEYSGGTNEFLTKAVDSFVFVPEPGFAVDGAHHIFARGLSGLRTIFAVTVSELDSAGNVVREAFEEVEASGVGVDSAHQVAYIDNLTEVRAFDIGSGERLTAFGAGQLGSGGAVAPNVTTGDVYVVDNATSEVMVYAPEPPGAPTVSGAEVHDVTSTSAYLQGVVNPHGTSTSYALRVCSEPSDCREEPIPNGALPANYSDLPVATRFADLSPETTYHYSVVARNAHGEASTPDHVLRTESAGPPVAMIDGRQWERVSPQDKRGAYILPLGYSTTQSSSDGTALTYLTNVAIGEGATGVDEVTQLFSKRIGPGVWSTADIATPNEHATGLKVGAGAEYRLFSSDLTAAVVEPPVREQLSSLATEVTPYLRDNASGAYEPFATTANAPAGAHIGQLEFLTGTPDLRTSVVFASVPLGGGAPSQGLYAWHAGRFNLISVLPDGSAAEGPGTSLGASSVNMRNALSPDGTRFIWSEAGHLYLRDLAQPRSQQLDLVQGGEPSTPEAIFEGASSDLNRVFFKDSERLTSNASSERDDLYVYEAATGHVTDLSASIVPGESAAVQGVIPGAADDGDYVYFVANGALTKDAVSGTCEREAATLDAECNLYVEHRGASGWEAPSLIAVLNNRDYGDWGRGSDIGLRNVTTRVSPSGRYLAFMSAASLTGYDNRDSVSARRDAEVFLYDASASDPALRLRCVSCDPTGQRPHGIFDNSLANHAEGLSVDGDLTWSGQWLAGNIPGWSPEGLSVALHQPRYLSDAGRVFFNSADSLVPADANSSEDVYEFEPAGAGQCRSATGCLALTSSGTARDESSFVDASESGDDVFFITSAKLANDADTASDVYDAHVCSALAPCVHGETVVAGASCESAGTCRGAAATVTPPPVESAPSSNALLGLNGNVEARRSPKLAKAHRPKRRRCASKRRKRHVAKCAVSKRKLQRKGR